MTTTQTRYARDEGMVQGVDSSYDWLTYAEAKALIDSGVKVYWQCLWTGKERPRAAISNLIVAYEAGFEWVGAYISLNGDSTVSGHRHVRYGRNRVPLALWNQLDFVAVDVELPGIQEYQVIQAIDELEAQGKSVELGEAVIYTSYNAWTNYLRGTTPGQYPLAQRGVLLINAFWDRWPDVDFPDLQYGNWTPDQVLGEQWSGGYLHPSGQFVDRNTFMVRLLKGGDKEEMDIDQETEKLRAQLRVAALGSRLMSGALADQPLSHTTRNQIRYLLDLADSEDRKRGAL